MKKYIKIIFKKLRHYQVESYALNCLDHKLGKIIKKRKGFFIEVGANDGINQSNTLYFEIQRGWRGLLIEPVPAKAESCRNNRPNCIVENCALVSSEYPRDFIEMHYCDLMSFVEDSIQDKENWILDAKKYMGKNDLDYTFSIKAKTLNQVLSEHNIEKADLLSLDVEGYELEVLKGLDFNNIHIDFLLIEARKQHEGNIEKYLSKWYKRYDILSDNEQYSDILYIKVGLCKIRAQ